MVSDLHNFTHSLILINKSIPVRPAEHAKKIAYCLGVSRAAVHGRTHREGHSRETGLRSPVRHKLCSIKSAVFTLLL